MLTHFEWPKIYPPPIKRTFCYWQSGRKNAHLCTWITTIQVQLSISHNSEVTCIKNPRILATAYWIEKIISVTTKMTTQVTLGITTLLSMTVFLMVIGESMPPTSEKLPLIGQQEEWRIETINILEIGKLRVRWNRHEVI